MSLFGALMGDLNDDPFLGNHMRRMNQMMNCFFRDPFQDMLMGPPGMMGNEMVPHHQPRHRGGNQLVNPDDFANPMMGGLTPFGGFPNLGRMFQDMSNGAGHISSMSTVMTMTQGPDGRPQVYQASTSMRQGPGGVRETKKTVADSRTGIKKMAIGHHIYDRAHVVEREQNIYSGDQEERQEFINLDEDEAEQFNKEWESKTRAARGPAIGYGAGHSGGRRHHNRREPEMLALPSSSETQHHNSTSRPTPRIARRTPQINHHSQSQNTSAAAKIAASQVDGVARKRKGGNERSDDQPKSKCRYINKEPIEIEEVENSDQEYNNDETDEPEVVEAEEEEEEEVDDSSDSEVIEVKSD